MDTKSFDKILLVGDDKICESLSICFAMTSSAVTWYTSHLKTGIEQLKKIDGDITRHGWQLKAMPTVIDHWPVKGSFDLVYLSNQIPHRPAKDFIKKVEDLHAKPTIAVGLVRHPLSSYQEGTSHPANLVGLNWAEPAYNTFFMEIVANEKTDPEVANRLHWVGKNVWRKDPYLIKGEFGIQHRLMAAMLREALFLLKNHYASAADIDRACRNDAGTYLPFAGNFRYMDLMGTYLYGLVMEELNGTLSNDNSVRGILDEMVANHCGGMHERKGFYKYPENSTEMIDQKMRQFSFTIRNLMEKFNGLQI